MGERKVLNRYISPDFDPSIIPRIKRDRSKLIEVRTMLPFSMRCSTCGEYMYKGKKFNSRMERVEGDVYLGIKKYRFYIKCSVCSSEITFKTDPKNSDYECESGATRNFELWRDNEAEREADEVAREEEERIDSMKSLENRTIDSKIEMDVLDGLDEIRAINQRHERIDTARLLEAHRVRADVADKEELCEFDTEIASVKFKSKSIQSSVDSDEDEEKSGRSGDLAGLLLGQISKEAAERKSSSSQPAIAGVIIKKKRKVEDGAVPSSVPQTSIEDSVKAQKTESASTATAPTPASSGIAGMLASYGSDSD